MKMIGRKTSLREHLVFLALGFFFCMKQEQKKTGALAKKNTSDSIQPHVYELDAIQPDVQYFRTSNWISPGSLVSRPLVKGNKDSWYKPGSIPVETTNQSVRKNNL